MAGEPEQLLDVLALPHAIVQQDIMTQLRPKEQHAFASTCSTVLHMALAHGPMLLKLASSSTRSPERMAWSLMTANQHAPEVHLVLTGHINSGTFFEYTMKQAVTIAGQVLESVTRVTMQGLDLPVLIPEWLSAVLPNMTSVTLGHGMHLLHTLTAIPPPAPQVHRLHLPGHCRSEADTAQQLWQRQLAALPGLREMWFYTPPSSNLLKLIHQAVGKQLRYLGWETSSLQRSLVTTLRGMGYITDLRVPRQTATDGDMAGLLSTPHLQRLHVGSLNLQCSHADTACHWSLLSVACGRGVSPQLAARLPPSSIATLELRSWRSHTNARIQDYWCIPLVGTTEDVRRVAGANISLQPDCKAGQRRRDTATEATINLCDGLAPTAHSVAALLPMLRIYEPSSAELRTTLQLTPVSDLTASTWPAIAQQVLQLPRKHQLAVKLMNCNVAAVAWPLLLSSLGTVPLVLCLTRSTVVSEEDLAAMVAAGESGASVTVRDVQAVLPGGWQNRLQTVARAAGAVVRV